MPEPQLESPKKATCFASGTGQIQAIVAVKAFFSPATMRWFCTKKDAAKMFGVSPQLFYCYQMKKRESFFFFFFHLIPLNNPMTSMEKWW